MKLYSIELFCRRNSGEFTILDTELNSIEKHLLCVSVPLWLSTFGSVESKDGCPQFTSRYNKSPFFVASCLICLTTLISALLGVLRGENLIP